MNNVIFTRRLKECRKRKFSSQQAFADAYMERYGLIRNVKESPDHNMFGTIQSWEQGKSYPSADVLSNICDLLDCDADYLLGRIDERKHDINDMKRYTGLSSEAIEQLHVYLDQLKRKEWWLDDLDSQNEYLDGYTLFFIDEILTGSKHHKLSAHTIYDIFTFVYENLDDEEDADIEDSRHIDSLIYSIIQSINAILSENAISRAFPPALRIVEKEGVYWFEADALGDAVQLAPSDS